MYNRDRHRDLGRAGCTRRVRVVADSALQHPGGFHPR